MLLNREVNVAKQVTTQPFSILHALTAEAAHVPLEGPTSGPHFSMCAKPNALTRHADNPSRDSASATPRVTCHSCRPE